MPTTLHQRASSDYSPKIVSYRVTEPLYTDIPDHSRKTTLGFRDRLKLLEGEPIERF